MEDKIPEEQPNKLLPLLPHLADMIANDDDVAKALGDILRTANLSKDEGVIQEVNSCIKVLQGYHVNPNAKQKEYATRLMDLGIPQASAELAIDRIRGTSEKQVESKLEELPSDIQFELARHNYVRVVMLAQQSHYPQEKIRQFQELALRQYASDFRNLPGFRVLVREWEIPQNEVKRILEQLGLPLFTQG
jgi:hypothetical protein